VNFFKLYIGDYQRDTAHLSLAEHGAFLLMLQHYYATEKPLPTGKALHRILRASEKADRDAIDSIAAQFWRTTDAGLVNDRADAEITKAAAQADTNRAIAKAREAAREAARKAAREKHDQSTNRATNDQPNHSHSHSQTTALGESSADGNSEVGAGAPVRPTEMTPGGAACRAMREAGVPPHLLNPEHAELLEAIAAGATPAEFGATAAELLAANKPAHMTYIVRAVMGRRRDAKARASPAQASGGVAARFDGKTYTGATDDELEAFFGRA
jgi:uncharacterized protein YdaU (DUF1376 family)